MRELFSAWERALRGGQPAVLVTVTASSGSTPGGAGARMLVGERGLLAGTIGGGEVEYRCLSIARELLGTGRPALRQFSLSQEDNAQLGMVCGGQVQVHFLPVPPGDRAMLALCRRALEYFETSTPFWLLTPLDGENAPILWSPRQEEGPDLPPTVTDQLGPQSLCLSWEGQTWFAEQLQRPGVVYIFGGGHVAQALVPVLAPLDFPCVVLEDREEFTGPELFPLARESRVIDLGDILRQVAITGEDYVCIMTRGHENDLLVQQQVLRTPARYIGLIGSARKAAISFAHLRKMGFAEEDLARIVTPIGLPIGGRSPQEIAISIAAQLIQYRSAGRRDFPTGGERL